MEECGNQPFKDVLVVSGEGRSLTLESDVDDGVVTEVCYLLEVSWQMCHAWITHWTVARAILTISRRRSTRDECTHGRDAREPLLARM